MTPEALADYFRARLGAKVTGTEVAYGQLTVTVEPDALPTAARLCKEDDKLDFAFFDFMSGVDLGDDGFAVVTHLYSVNHRHHVTLRAVAPGGREDPRLPSITGVYRGADWHEREAYDMFGVTFDGHPGLLPRILTVENFEGFPLRKDFLLSTREAKPWPGLKEPKEAGEDDGEDESATAAKAEEKKAAAAAKAERAKAKAAEMRAKKRAQRQAEAAGQADAQPGEDQAAAAERTGGGDTDAEAAAQVAAAAGEEAVQTPEGAAEVARTDIAKDAAAGSVQGDTVTGAPGDEPGVDQPVTDAAQEAAAGEGAPPVPGGTPGIEAEGAHADTPVGPAAEPAEPEDRDVDVPEPTKPRTPEGTAADPRTGRREAGEGRRPPSDPDAPHEGGGSQGGGGVGNEVERGTDDSDKDT